MVASIAKAASDTGYYSSDGYYNEGTNGYKESMAWHGEGAKALGLDDFSTADFKSVMDGYVIGTDQRLGRTRDGKHEHRTGTDITFSAPKSVSLAALIGGDKRIIEGHNRAVKTTLNYIENNLLESRIFNKETKATERIRDQKMVAATFVHEVSRNLDPQLHTHAVIANMSQGKDGKWRTIENNSLYFNIKLISAIYNNELAHNLKDLGYGIESKGTNGIFQLTDAEGKPLYSQKVQDAFSTRLADITAALEAKGLDPNDAALRQRSALMTREAKEQPDWQVLRSNWKEQTLAQGIEMGALSAQASNDNTDGEVDKQKTPEMVNGQSNPEINIDTSKPQEPASGQSNPEINTDTPKPPEPANDQSNPEKPTPAEIARSNVEWAIRHLEERNAVFGAKTLLATALDRDSGALRISDVEITISNLLESGRLIDASDEEGGKFTTDKALTSEQENIAHLEANQGTSNPIVKEHKINEYLSDTTLTKGQCDAVHTILASNDRIVGVQGYAGSGKTTMLNAMREIAENKTNATSEKNPENKIPIITAMFNAMREIVSEKKLKTKIPIIGLAPSASAAKTLEAESSIESKTLQSFLAKYSAISEGRAGAGLIHKMQEGVKGSIIVVDEASLASTNQMRDLLRITDALQPERVVLVGDYKQLDAVDAGKPFQQLQQAGMNTAVMDQIMRQRNPELKAAVIESLSGQPRAALERIDEHIIETKPQNLAKTAAKIWLDLSPENREKTGLLIPTHDLRHEANDLIRARLDNEGVLHGESAIVTQLTSTRLTEAEREIASNYQKGQMVLFERGIESLGISTGDTLTVDSKTDEMVSLTDKDGKSVSFDPAGGVAEHLDIYQPSNMELRAGDIIRWTRNDKELDLTNTHQAEVLGIGKDTVTLKTEDGRVLDMDIKEAALGHIDYNFNSTVHAYQGRTVDNVIAVLGSSHGGLTNQKTTYVTFSRAKDSIIFVTDNKVDLAATLEANTGEQLSALESIGMKLTGGKEIDDQLKSAVEEARKEYGISFEEFQSMGEGVPNPDSDYGNAPDYGAEGIDPEQQDHDYDPDYGNAGGYDYDSDYGDDAEYDDDLGGEETEPRQDIAANDSNHEKTHEVKKEIEFEL